MKSPRISLVVSIDFFHPVDCFVGGCLQQSLPFDDFEVIVVDAEPRESISTAIEQARMKTQGALNIQYFTIGNSSRAALNNFGVTQAGSELIVFVTNDFVLAPNFVDVHLRFHEQHPEPHIVGIGPGFAPEAQRAASRFLAWLEDSGKLFGVRFIGKEVRLPSSFFYVANTSVKKDFLLDTGRFDEDFPYPCWDDYEMGMRLTQNGMTSLFVPEGSAIHDHPITVSERLRSMRWAGESVALLAAKYKGLPFTRDPMWKYCLRRLALLFGGKTNLHESYWELILAAAFVWGYSREKFSQRSG